MEIVIPFLYVLTQTYLLVETTIFLRDISTVSLEFPFINSAMLCVSLKLQTSMLKGYTCIQEVRFKMLKFLSEDYRSCLIYLKILRISNTSIWEVVLRFLIGMVKKRLMSKKWGKR